MFKGNVHISVNKTIKLLYPPTEHLRRRFLGSCRTSKVCRRYTHTRRISRYSAWRLTRPVEVQLLTLFKRDGALHFVVLCLCATSAMVLLQAVVVRTRFRTTGGMHKWQLSSIGTTRNRTSFACFNSDFNFLIVYGLFFVTHSYFVQLFL